MSSDEASAQLRKSAPPFHNERVCPETNVSVAQFPEILAPLFSPIKYKVLWGGRGGMKSWTIARAIVLRMSQRPTRVLCVREQMNSLKESVHKLLADQIMLMGLSALFDIQRDVIRCIAGPGAGSECGFEGIRHNVMKIKSYEGIDICWVEEAANVSKNSWQVLLPTIRKDDSEIWISFNPELETDETYKRWVLNPPPNAWVQKVNYWDNPWLSASFLEEVEYMKAHDYDSYLHVYEGNCRATLEGAVYADELRLCTAQKRITKLPYDPTLAVHTVWDIGWADATAIWFFQRAGRETHFINYFETTRTTLEKDLKYCRDLGYLYDTFWLPHDSKAKTKGSKGLSVLDQVRAAGFQARDLPRLGIGVRINLARSLFANSYFDEKLCADGLQCLRHYQYELVEDPIKKTFSKEPKHDWTSHGADSFSYAAVAMKLPATNRTGRLGKVLNELETAKDDFFENLARFSSKGSSSTGWMQ